MLTTEVMITGHCRKNERTAGDAGRNHGMEGDNTKVSVLFAVEDRSGPRWPVSFEPRRVAAGGLRRSHHRGQRSDASAVVAERPDVGCTTAACRCRSAWN